jgi:glucose/mannose-6-phosphate isomerase
MHTLVTKFPTQLVDAIQIAQKIKLKAPKHISQIIACGLWWSGIGSMCVAEYVADKCRIPMTINQDYQLPRSLDKHSLVLVCSYSGNTEESVEMMHQAIQAKAHIVVISSWGQLTQLAHDHKIPYVLIPWGMPPRSCIGYSIVQQLYILKCMKLIKKHFETDLRDAITLLTQEQTQIIKESQKIASKLHSKTPIIYIQSKMESVAIRLRQNINENSKMLCRHHVVPEMNHNELVWRWWGKSEYAVLRLRNHNDTDRIQKRIKLNQDVITRQTQTMCEVYSKGDNFLVQALYLIHFGDWLSIHLADLNKVDPMDITVINNLKNSLGEQKVVFKHP